MMRAYELMVILEGDLDEPVAQAWVKTITDAIEKAGGSVHGKADWWGKRQFAYPIEKKEYGYYAVFNLVAPGGALDELERSFRKFAITARRLERHVGSELEVLVEEPVQGEALALGRAYLQAPEVDGLVVLKAAGLEAGRVYRARIDRRNGVDLEGSLVGA